jgi:hypothetical protein
MANLTLAMERELLGRSDRLEVLDGELFSVPGFKRL